MPRTSWTAPPSTFGSSSSELILRRVEDHDANLRVGERHVPLVKRRPRRVASTVAPTAVGLSVVRIGTDEILHGTAAKLLMKRRC